MRTPSVPRAGAIRGGKNSQRRRESSAAVPRPRSEVEKPSSVGPALGAGRLLPGVDARPPQLKLALAGPADVLILGHGESSPCLKETPVWRKSTESETPRPRGRRAGGRGDRRGRVVSGRARGRRGAHARRRTAGRPVHRRIREPGVHREKRRARNAKGHRARLRPTGDPPGAGPRSHRARPRSVRGGRVRRLDHRPVGSRGRGARGVGPRHDGRVRQLHSDGAGREGLLPRGGPDPGRRSRVRAQRAPRVGGRRNRAAEGEEPRWIAHGRRFRPGSLHPRAGSGTSSRGGSRSPARCARGFHSRPRSPGGGRALRRKRGGAAGPRSPHGGSP